MRLVMTVLLSLSLLLSSDILARSSSRSGGSSFRSSPRSAPSRPAPSKPAPSKPSAPAQAAPSKPTQPSTINKATTTTTQKPKAVSPTAVDKKQQKMLAAKDQTAAKKYSTKAAAENDYKASLAKQSTYTSPTPPAQKPSYIPDVTSNGRPVTYNVYPDGRYGYGYMDPTTMLFVALAADHYVVDPYQMRSAGYGNWDASGRPIVVRNSHGFLIFFIILWLGVVVAVFIVAAIKDSK